MIWRVGEQRKDQQNLLQLRPEISEVRGHSLARSDGKIQDFKLVGYRCRLHRAASQKMQFTKLRLAGLLRCFHLLYGHVMLQSAQSEECCRSQ